MNDRSDVALFFYAMLLLGIGEYTDDDLCDWAAKNRVPVELAREEYAKARDQVSHVLGEP